MYLLDTNILSELRKGERCDAKVRAWARSTVNNRHCISALSLGEIRKGIEMLRRKAPDQCPAFEAWLLRLQTDYDHDILPLTAGISGRWRRRTLVNRSCGRKTVDQCIVGQLQLEIARLTRFLTRFPDPIPAVSN